MESNTMKQNKTTNVLSLTLRTKQNAFESLEPVSFFLSNKSLMLIKGACLFDQKYSKNGNIVKLYY